MRRNDSRFQAFTVINVRTTEYQDSVIRNFVYKSSAIYLVIFVYLSCLATIYLVFLRREPMHIARRVSQLIADRGLIKNPPRSFDFAVSV